MDWGELILSFLVAGTLMYVGMEWFMNKFVR